MYIAGRWADRQLSRLEMVVAVILIGLLVSLLLQYMLRMFAVAERSLLSTTIMNVNTALQYRAAWYQLNEDYIALETMQQMNPFAMTSLNPLLTNPETAAGMPPQMLSGIIELAAPANYLGELGQAAAGQVDGGQWYFDRLLRTLVYRVDNSEYFESNLDGPARVEFYVDIDYEDINNNNRFDAQAGEYRGIRLRSVSEYAWRQ